MRLIDWLLVLPEGLAVPVMERVQALHEEGVLRRLLREAAFLPSLEAFVAQIPN